MNPLRKRLEDIKPLIELNKIKKMRKELEEYAEKGVVSSFWAEDAYRTIEYNIKKHAPEELEETVAALENIKSVIALKEVERGVENVKEFAAQKCKFNNFDTIFNLIERVYEWIEDARKYTDSDEEIGKLALELESAERTCILNKYVALAEEMEEEAIRCNFDKFNYPNADEVRSQLEEHELEEEVVEELIKRVGDAHFAFTKRYKKSLIPYPH